MPADSSSARVVLVTGVSRPLAARVAHDLAAHPGVEVVAVDVVPPAFDLGLARFVRADIANPVIAKVIRNHEVDTVVHLAIVASAAHGGEAAMKETNVIGTMQLLAAVQRSDRLRRFVLQSSASVYGSSARDPARFTEDMSARVAPRSGLGRDSVEIEGYVRGLGRRRPGVEVVMLRLADLVGPGVDSDLVHYLTLPVVPKVAGFDARLQFLHPDDATAVVVRAGLEDFVGTFNVAADDVLTLTQVCRLLGRPTLAVPAAAAPAMTKLSRRVGGAHLAPDQLQALIYGRGMATSRLRETTGFVPQYSSRTAVVALAAAGAPGALSPARLGGRLDALLEQVSVG